MAYCPNCSVELRFEECSTYCRNCGALFGSDAAWSPNEGPVTVPVPSRRAVQHAEPMASDLDRRMQRVVSPPNAEAVEKALAFTVVGHVLLRLIFSATTVAAMVVLAFLSTLPYGGGGAGLLALAGFAFFFLAGWSLLPLYRASRAFRLILGTCWILFGIGTLLVNAPGATLRPFSLWLFATVCLLICLPRRLPDNRRDMQSR